ncbi:MAG: hypothetical protein HQM01_05510 [Magnetococcales bacterium]|nr:hypothetical protein [Magnetococcales bacterium]
MGVLLWKLFRSADDRGLEMVRAAAVGHHLTCSGIGDMPAIPGQKVIHAVNRRQGDMNRVLLSGFWKTAGAKNLLGQITNRFLARQAAQSVQESQPSLGGIRITTAHFLDDQFRNEQLKPVALFVPPLVGDLLVGGNNQISARQGSQITDDAGLQIESGFHDTQVTRLSS